MTFSLGPVEPLSSLLCYTKATLYKMEKIIASSLRVVMRFIWVKVCKSIQNNAWQKVSLFSVSCLVVFNSLQPHGLYPARLLCSWNSPDENTGVGIHFLLQGIFLTQGSNPGLPHCRQILSHLSHHRSFYFTHGARQF